MTDQPFHGEQERATIQGIADYLRQENPELDTFQARTEALRLDRVQYNAEVLPPEP